MNDNKLYLEYEGVVGGLTRHRRIVVQWHNDKLTTPRLKQKTLIWNGKKANQYCKHQEEIENK